MQHILLTGATGFLGSHLLEALLKEGYQVTILKRSTSNTWRIDHVLPRVIAFDVDLVPVEDAFRSNQIDAVIHTACNYGRNQQTAHEILETNLLFGITVLEKANFFGSKIFINTDTFFNTGDSCSQYLNHYTLSKKQFVEWLRCEIYSIKVVNLKLQHIYGPKDDNTKFVPWVVSQLEQRSRRISLTEGTQLRDFVYVDDVVSAYLLTLQEIEQLPDYKEFQVGTGTLISVREFVTALRRYYQILDSSCNTELGFGDVPMRDGELVDVEVDNAKLKELGWRAKVTLDKGVARLFSAQS